MKKSFCGNSYNEKVTITSKARFKGSVLVKINMPTSFSDIVIMDGIPTTLVIPEGCFHLKFKAKSLSGGGQAVEIKVVP